MYYRSGTEVTASLREMTSLSSSYHIIMYISEALVQKHQRRGPKQTGKFSVVLQMFPPTVSSHECWVADCSRYSHSHSHHLEIMRSNQRKSDFVNWCIKFPVKFHSSWCDLKWWSIRLFWRGRPNNNNNKNNKMSGDMRSVPA